MRNVKAGIILLIGMAWPLAAWWYALHRLLPYFMAHQKHVIAYALGATIFPAVGILYGGGLVITRDKLPYPANIAGAMGVAAVCFLIVTVLFWGAFGTAVQLPKF